MSWGLDKMLISDLIHKLMKYVQPKFYKEFIREVSIISHNLLEPLH